MRRSMVAILLDKNLMWVHVKWSQLHRFSDETFIHCKSFLSIKRQRMREALIPRQWNSFFGEDKVVANQLSNMMLHVKPWGKRKTDFWSENRTASKDIPWACGGSWRCWYVVRWVLATRPWKASTSEILLWELKQASMSFVVPTWDYGTDQSYSADWYSGPRTLIRLIT